MKEEAYYELNQLENHHWWYVGARATYKTLLQIGVGAPSGQSDVLDVGSGSGGNFPLLEAYGSVTGLEYSRTALRLTPEPYNQRCLQASADMLPFSDAAFDIVTLFGVIEHLDDDVSALREARRVCRPAGIVVLLTSAAPQLWSHHDVANNHKRRYTRAQLKQKIERAGLTPQVLSHQNFFTYFPTLLVRQWQRRFGHTTGYDMGNPPQAINRLLTTTLKIEASLLHYVRLPLGVDLVALCRPATLS